MSDDLTFQASERPNGRPLEPRSALSDKVLPQSISYLCLRRLSAVGAIVSFSLIFHSRRRSVGDTWEVLVSTFIVRCAAAMLHTAGMLQTGSGTLCAEGVWIQ